MSSLLTLLLDKSMYPLSLKWNKIEIFMIENNPVLVMAIVQNNVEA